jgi:hypothetical protein
MEPDSLVSIADSSEDVMPLEQEQATYDRELPNLRAHPGKWVLIQGDKVIGLYDTYNDALKVGYDTFKLLSFLVKQIQAVEQVHCVTRDIVPCPS